MNRQIRATTMTPEMEATFSRLTSGETKDAIARAKRWGPMFPLIAGKSYDQVAGLSVIYGSITAVLVFLSSVYLYASALLFGAELAAAWSAPPEEGPSEPLLLQIRRAVFGLFVRQKPPAGPPSSPHG